MKKICLFLLTVLFSTAFPFYSCKSIFLPDISYGRFDTDSDLIKRIPFDLELLNRPLPLAADSDLLKQLVPLDSDMINRMFPGRDRVPPTLDENAKAIGLNYKLPGKYTQSYKEVSFIKTSIEDTPEELLIGVGNLIVSQWIHEDGECILFINSSRGYDRLLGHRDADIPGSTFNRIRWRIKMGNPFINTTDEQMEELKKIITFWPQKEAEKIFNAQHVITYPIEDPKAIYKGKYVLRENLCMLKWGEYLTISFLLTDKGYKNRNQYMKDVKKAFRFND
jgi:hypothetical protein